MHLSLSEKILIFAISIIFIMLIYQLSPVLQPFYLAVILSYLSNPIVDRLEKIKIPRVIAVLFVFVIIFAFFIILGLFLIPQLFTQIQEAISNIPLLINWFQNNFIPWMNQKLPTELQIPHRALQTTVFESITTHKSAIPSLLRTLSESGLNFLGWLFKLFLIPVVTFYLLRDWNKVIYSLRKLLPRSIAPTVTQLVERYNEVLHAFLKGQLSVMLILGAFYTIGLWLVGLQLAILIGFFAGLLNIVPYLGFTIGIVTALIAAYVQFQSFLPLVYVAIVFFIGISLEGMVLTPLLVGDSIGLHPVAVIFSVMVGAYYFGFLGALLALPVAAAIMVLLRYFSEKYYHSKLYSKH